MAAAVRIDVRANVGVGGIPAQGSPSWVHDDEAPASCDRVLILAFTFRRLFLRTGGIGTIHAGSALGALQRLEQLVQEAVLRALVAETVNVIAVLGGRGCERRLIELSASKVYDPPAMTSSCLPSI